MAIYFIYFLCPLRGGRDSILRILLNNMNDQDNVLADGKAGRNDILSGDSTAGKSSLS